MVKVEETTERSLAPGGWCRRGIPIGPVRWEICPVDKREVIKLFALALAEHVKGSIHKE